MILRICLEHLCQCAAMCSLPHASAQGHVPVCCSMLQCVAVRCSVLQSVAVHCSVLQCVAVCCSVLQCVAVCCSVLQSVTECCSVLYCNALNGAHFGPQAHASMTNFTNQRATMHCSVLQCAAVCCSVLQCAAVCCNVLQCIALCCSVLQCAAMRCSVFQCVLHSFAVCCIVLQRAVLCCSVLQNVRVSCIAVCRYSPRMHVTHTNMQYRTYPCGKKEGPTLTERYEANLNLYQVPLELYRGSFFMTLPGTALINSIVNLPYQNHDYLSLFCTVGFSRGKSNFPFFFIYRVNRSPSSSCLSEDLYT